MKSVMFTNASEVYQVTHIAYAGPVVTVPEEKRKHGCSHFFKIITAMGTTYCNYSNADSAMKARGALAAKIDSCKPTVFKHGKEIIDPSKIISFSNVILLKSSQDDRTHAIVVTIGTVDDKNARIWLTYRSEDSAQKGRKALFASIYACNDVPQKKPAEDTVTVASTLANNLPF